MIYVIDVPPRCGKTQLALRLCRNRGLPFISTDVLRGVLEVARTNWRTPMEKVPDRLPVASERFRPYFERLLEMLQEGTVEFAVEGEVVLPPHAASLASTFTLRSVFLVRNQVDPARLVEKPGSNPWLAGSSDEVLDAVASEVRAYSSSIARQCAELRLPCVDVGGDFEAGMREAEEQLGLA